MATKVVPKELKELDGLEGAPLDLLRKTLDILGVSYITPEPPKEDKVVRRIAGIALHPFLEPNSVVFIQAEEGGTLITAIEQLTKVPCLAFRTQLNTGDDNCPLTHSDLITHIEGMQDKRSGRILLQARNKDLRILMETKPGDKIGQGSLEVILKDCLPQEYKYPNDQTLEIRLSYKGDYLFTLSLVGKVCVWNF